MVASFYVHLCAFMYRTAYCIYSPEHVNTGMNPVFT